MIDLALPRAGVLALCSIAAVTMLTTVLIAVADSADAGAGSPSPSASSPASDGDPIALAPIVAAWPDGYSVTGTKSEPLYVEHITSLRNGDRYTLTIDVESQGESALGVQHGAVLLEADGRIRWIDGCTKPAGECADDPGLRGFLAQAALLGALQRGVLAADSSGTARTLHGHPVVCVPDRWLYPDSPPTIDGLDPCFSIATGALLGHWSTPSSAFVGPTLADGLVDQPS
ncbi:hypothetical protein [Herbiconiux sp.]|uniref:hypothetical protein n=1 Tax=Herbiconiux sp. TaxID=1871186 RepID=UPI0025C18081|nr:hypothetical protein [Herbiconiux sp.]